MDKWDFKLEGKICPCCKGSGMVLEPASHKGAEGWIPCPNKRFQGVGYPICGPNNRLHFEKRYLK